MNDEPEPTSVDPPAAHSDGRTIEADEVLVLDSSTYIREIGLMSTKGSALKHYLYCRGTQLVVPQAAAEEYERHLAKRARGKIELIRKELAWLAQFCGGIAGWSAPGDDVIADRARALARGEGLEASCLPETDGSRVRARPRNLAERPPARHALLEEAILLNYSPANPRYGELFVFDSANEVRAKRDATLHEARAASAMTLLASIEASFRVDYLQRNYAKKRDDMSRALRDHYRQKRQRVSLTDDILQRWQEHSDVTPMLVGNIRGAFSYRDWLAHGRCWFAKLGRQYDFGTLYGLGRDIETAFPFLRS